MEVKVLFLEIRLNLLFKGIDLKEVNSPNPDPSHLIFITRTNAATRGPNFFLSFGLLSGQINSFREASIRGEMGLKRPRGKLESPVYRASSFPRFLYMS